MDVIYSRSRVAIAKGQRFQNPRHFAGPLEGATSVHIDGDYPLIEAAYAAEGVAVTRLDVLTPLSALVEPQEADIITIPADWRDLPWSQPDERGLTLRGVASSVSQGPIKTKDEAVAAVEAYLGVTKTED